MSYRGDIRLGQTIDIKETLVNTAGVPTTLAGSPVVSAYVGNGTTEITAGITLTVDFDGRTGLVNVRVVATSGNGFATATDVDLVITTGTVGGSTVVGYVIGSFSIENRSAVMPTIGGRTLDVSAGGEAGLDWANIGSPTTAQNLSATNIDVDQVVASVSGAVGSVTGAVGSVTGAVGSVGTGGITAASIAADAIGASELAADAVTEIRSLASGTSDSGTTTTMVDAARTEADTDYWKGLVIVFTSGNIAGQARLITGFNATTDTITFTPATTQAVATQTYEIWPGSRADLGQILGADVSTTTAQLGVNTVQAGGTAWGSGAITAGAIATDALGALELAADAVAEIADAVWDEDATGHQVQGTFGQAIGDPVADANTIFKAVVTDATGATVGVDVVAVKAETAAILDDTDDIGVAGAGLTAIDLPDQTMNITGNITGNLSGSVGSVTGSVGSVTAQVAANVAEIDSSATAASSLRRGVLGNVLGTVGSASTTTSIVTSSLSPAAAVTDQFKGRILTFKDDTTTANLRGQATDITASTSVGVLLVTSLTTAPVSGDSFVIT